MAQKICDSHNSFQYKKEYMFIKDFILSWNMIWQCNACQNLRTSQKKLMTMKTMGLFFECMTWRLTGWSHFVRKKYREMATYPNFCLQIKFTSWCFTSIWPLILLWSIKYLDKQNCDLDFEFCEYYLIRLKWRN